MLRGRGPVVGFTLVLAAACGGSEPASRSSQSPATAAAPATAAPTTAPGTSPVRTVVPDVVLRDVGSGTDVNLRTLAQPDRPTLYWFWAPH